MHTFMEDIEDAELALEDRQGRFLLERGWRYTCDNPGSLWLWRKDHYRVGLTTALAMERRSVNAWREDQP